MQGQSIRKLLLQQLTQAQLLEPLVELSALWRARSASNSPLNAHSTLSHSLIEQLRSDVARRAKREPFARIVNTREFYSHDFRLNNACLIPRNDSETLVDVVINASAKSNAPLVRIRELGCGSGCIIISIARALADKQSLRIISASDNSKKALLAARKNNAQVPSRLAVRFLHSDWLKDKQQNQPKKFDLIIANPPYVRRKDRHSLQLEVQRFEPRRALDGGFSGMQSIGEVCIQAHKRLRIGGLLVLEHAPKQARMLEKLAKRNGYSHTRLFHDLNGQARVTLLKRCRKKC